MGVDKVVSRPQPIESLDNAQYERYREQGAATRRLHATVNVYPLHNRLAWQVGISTRDNVNLVPTPDKLRPLRKGLPLRAAGHRIKVADHVANA